MTGDASEIPPPDEHGSGQPASLDLAAIEEGNERLADAAYLPDRERYPDPSDDERVVRDFEHTCRGVVGRTIVPLAELRDDPVLIATAIDRELERIEGLGLDPMRHKVLYQQGIDAFVDLQAFRDVDDARIVAAAQATAISIVRREESILGALNALTDRPVPVGSARRAFDAVDLYRSRQSLGFLTLMSWPVSAGIGWGIGAVLMRPSLAVAVILVMGWFGAPFLGAVAGTISSAIDRAALRSTSTLLLKAGRAASLIGVGIIAAVPALLGVLGIAAATSLGLS
jgi:hypothetical protein